MSDQYTEVSEQGFGSSLMDSIKGVAVGGLLFVLSFPVLWWNEGRTDMSEVAKKATVVKADAVDKSAEGKLISVTGELQTDETIGDPEFLKPGKYLRVERVVEMYAWTEDKDTKTKKKLGGGKKTETTYTYEMEWTKNPQPPSKFKVPLGHENPSLPIEGQTFSVKKARVGAYAFAPADAEMPGAKPLALTKDLVTVAAAPSAAPAEEPGEAPEQPAAKEGGDEAAPAAAPAEEAPKAKKKKRSGRRPKTLVPAPSRAASDAANKRAAALDRRRPTSYELANESFLYRGLGNVTTPKLGDIRVSFRVVSPGVRSTLYGQLAGAEVQAYTKGDDKLFRVIPGSHEEAIQTMASEHKMMTWILRFVGWLIMWIGLTMFFGPINAVLDVIPFLGSAGRFLIGVAMFPVSAVLSIVVIVLSIIAHSPILLILTMAGLGAGGYFLWQKKKKAKAGGAAPPQAPVGPAGSMPAPTGNQQWQ